MILKKGLTRFYTIAALTAVIANGTNIALANNYKDEAYDFYYHGDGSDVPSLARNKEDDTYTYVRSKDTSEGVLGVGAAAKKGVKKDTFGDPFNYDYCTDRYRIDIGNRKYFENLSHKKGYKTTYLVMASGDHKAHNYYGVWSPDNISGYK